MQDNKGNGLDKYGTEVTGVVCEDNKKTGCIHNPFYHFLRLLIPATTNLSALLTQSFDTFFQRRVAHKKLRCRWFIGNTKSHH